MPQPNLSDTYVTYKELIPIMTDHTNAILNKLDDDVIPELRKTKSIAYSALNKANRIEEECRKRGELCPGTHPDKALAMKVKEREARQAEELDVLNHKKKVILLYVSIGIAVIMTILGGVAAIIGYIQGWF